MFWGEFGSGVVEQAEFFAQQEGAVEALVGLADLVQGGEPADARSRASSAPA
jgi:hypothetical protein